MLYFTTYDKLEGIKAIPGIKRMKQCEIIFRDEIYFMLAMQALNNKVARIFHVFQAFSGGLLLKKLQSRTLDQLLLKDKQLLLKDNQLLLKDNQLENKETQILVERFSVANLICKHFNQTYDQCKTNRVKICDDWRNKGWIFNPTGKCYKFTSLRNVQLAKDNLDNYMKGQPTILDFF